MLKVVSLAIAGLLCVTSADAAVMYTVTKIGTATATDISNAGRIALSGASIYQNGTTSAVTGLPSGTSTISDISDTMIVGSTYNSATSSTVAWKKVGNTVTQLTGLSGTYVNTYANAVNASGQIVGNGTAYGVTSHVLTWNGTTMTDLGTMGRTEAYGIDINDSGVIVGNAKTSSWNSSTTRAFVYSNGSSIEIATGGKNSYAAAINNNGVVAIYGNTANGQNGAYLWSNNQLTDLGTVVGLSNYTLTGLNDAGVAVGYASGNASYSGIVYRDGAMFDLNSLIDPSLGISITEARGINASGQIIANGTLNGSYASFLLNPLAAVADVPEPSSWALMIIGFGAVGGAMRRQRATALA